MRSRTLYLRLHLRPIPRVRDLGHEGNDIPQRNRSGGKGYFIALVHEIP